MRKIFLLVLVLVLFIAAVSFAQGEGSGRGVWVTVFSAKRVLYSKGAVLELINTCKKADINEIYIQLFQSGRAFYDSGIADRSKYEEIVQAAGFDTIEFLIEESAKNNIKVFAWVNLLSLGQNSSADILKRFGDEVLTRDQYLKPSGRKEPHELDRYYLREDQLFLEPGDPRVDKYLVLIIDEVLKRYPGLSGIHLDYIRYPLTVPFIPGSKFAKFGLNYGYGRKNLSRFRDWSGIDPLKGLNSEEACFKWDNWKRLQVTNLVKRIAKHAKARSPGCLVSCAVIPSYERAYSSLFQDWVYWLNEGIVDYAVLMNYSKDNQLSEEIANSASCFSKKGKVYMGLGLFLLKDNLHALQEQYRMIKASNTAGVVFFSYDDITKETLQALR